MISAETIQLLKKSLKKGTEIWIYTRGGSGGGNGDLVEITDDFIILEGIHRGKKFLHYFVLNTIESIKVYQDTNEK